MTAYYTLRSKLKSLLEEHENAKFIVTGHSLGGTLSILFPTMLVMREEKDMMEKLFGVYTFGQPRTGNRQLGRDALKILLLGLASATEPSSVC
ncbi:hypothetical protein RIF29_31602 [Crotalaria pallida]|uniref:Fungal lipase-type domain-containing protein n=1 Tax=Crotalaria pallida TaxID=3830 RepID=A0AAN9EHD0_CROPI